MMFARAGFATALVVLVGAFSASSAMALTSSPGWSISSVAQPTNFSIADSEIGVESLTVKAEGGKYELSVFDGITRGNEETPLIEWNESAGGLQSKLEGMPSVGSGNVKVSGGPGDATGSHPYTIEWPGKFAGWPTTAYNNGHAGGLELNGVVGEGSLEEKTEHLARFNDRYTLTATNAGSRPTGEGGEVTITSTLPEGLVPVSMEVEEPRTGFSEPCAVTVPLKCVYNGEPVRPGGELKVTLYVGVVSPAVKGALVNEASVSGGGGVGGKARETNAVNVGPAPFGIEQLAFDATGLEGGLDMQAGDHPYGVTTTIDLNTVFTDGRPLGRPYAPSQEVKDVAVELPLGFAGDPLAAERCPEIDMTDVEAGGAHTTCPPGSRVGTVKYVRESGNETGLNGEKPVYNMVPEHGFPAELGFVGLGQPVFIYASVVPGRGGYRLRLATPGVLRAEGIEAIMVTIFGSPAERDGIGGGAAFLTNPSACSGEPLSVRAEVTAWEGGSDVREATAYPSVTGCDLLIGSASFSPSIEVQPETTQADTPSGYEVDLKVPQAPNLFGALATPDLKNATVTLPAGVRRGASPACA